MPIEISGKRVIVTGGARGIGAAAVSVLAAEGARVVSFDVLDELGEQVAAETTTQGTGTAGYRHVDISDRAAVVDATASAVAELGGLDTMVNIAGIERRCPAEDLSEADWDEVFGVNVKGTLFTNQAAFPHLKERGGSIVNFGSDAALRPYVDGAHYSASKGAVISFTRTIAGEWGRYGIRANAVVPAIWTPMYDEYRERLTPEQLTAHEAQMAERIPLGGRLGDPVGDLAPVLVFLTSDASRFMTGQIVSVNGGNQQVR
jgi:NAD(P)-dependent dehydrogenase (short-subunit alcohol dehydrogenase family)